MPFGKVGKLRLSDSSYEGISQTITSEFCKRFKLGIRTNLLQVILLPKGITGIDDEVLTKEVNDEESLKL